MKKRETRADAMKRAFAEELAANPDRPPRRTDVVKRGGPVMIDEDGHEAYVIPKDARASVLDACDLFAGPGGWDVGAEVIGLRVHGIEFDAAAVETRRAAGLRTTEGDVRAYGPADFPARGLIASPPCQPFSASRPGVPVANGAASLDRITDAADLIARGADPDLSGFSERAALVLEPLRWVRDARRLGAPYEWIAFEQVPDVLPLWEHLGEILSRWGYRTASGVLTAEAYGVPQTRRRAILVGRLGESVALPEPIHAAYRKGKPLDPSLPAPVSMIDALGWPEGYEFGDVYNRNGAIRPTSAPAPTITASADNGNFRLRKIGDSGNGRAITVEEAGVLQTFPVSYPWSGTKKKAFEQVGNAVPPALAEHVLRAVALPKGRAQ